MGRGWYGSGGSQSLVTIWHGEASGRRAVAGHQRVGHETGKKGIESFDARHTDIFLGVDEGFDRSWVVRGVKPLKGKEEEEAKSYPSETEPSDHVLIWADLLLVEGEAG